MELKITEIKAWCPECMGKDKHVKEILFVNGSVELILECGHIIKERFTV